MNFTINWFLFLMLYRFASKVECSPRLTAVTDVTHEYVHQLYRKLRNADPPSKEWDQAALDAQIRQRICEDIFSSGMFLGSAIQMHKIYAELVDQQRYLGFFHQIFGPKKSKVELLFQPYEYTNPYALLAFEVGRMVDGQPEFYWTKEYVFMCLVKREHGDEIIPYYVSKEYNVSESTHYTAGRFVFGVKRHLPEREMIKLVEEPAVVWVRANFDIELYYLEMRDKYNPAASNEDDPLCKLVTNIRRKNHYYRICAKVLNSPHFEADVKYQFREWRTSCIEKVISFKTRAVENVYQERMIPCFYANHSGRLRKLYISRAYRSHEVFVYARDTFDDKIYVKNLSTNMYFIREPIFLNFDDVES